MNKYDYFLIIGCIFCLYNGNAQIISKGSISIAAVCKDGIVVASDTRGGFWAEQTNGVPDFKKDPLCYYDTIQKVDPIKKFILCSIGQVTFNDKYLFYYIQEYERSLQNNTTVGYAKEGFLNFINTNYPSEINSFYALK